MPKARQGEYLAPDTKMMELRRRGKERIMFEKHHEQTADARLIRAYKESTCEFERSDKMEELVHHYLDVIYFAYNNPGKRPGQQIAKNLSFSFDNEDREDLFCCALTCFVELVHEYEEEAGIFEHFVRSTLRHRVFNQFFQVEVDEQIHTRALKEGEDFIVEMKSILLEDDDKISLEHIDLYTAMNSLTKRQKEVFTMLVVNGWDSTQVSIELGIVPGYIRTIKRQVITKLKAQLGK